VLNFNDKMQLVVSSFVDATHVAVAKADGTSETIEAKKYIATGSASSLPFIKIDKDRIITLY
jgi:dihydrolipoamide dehydrogenase